MGVRIQTCEQVVERSSKLIHISMSVGVRVSLQLFWRHVSSGTEERYCKIRGRLTEYLRYTKIADFHGPILTYEYVARLYVPMYNIQRMSNCNTLGSSQRHSQNVLEVACSH